MISAVILTKNEEENIKKCLDCVLWCDEKLLIDDYSTDNTVDLARKLGAKVFERRLGKDFSAQRNFGISKAKNEWVLFIDADEIVSDDLKKEILKKVQENKEINGYFIKRQDFVFGKKIKHGEFGENSLVRLAKKNAGSWKGKVHEKWEIKGEVGKLTHTLEHFSHHSIDGFLRKINFYTDVRAKELYERGTKASFFSIIIYPKLKFIQNYFLKLGFMDRTTGLVLAIMMSLHSFLVRGKLWLLWNKN
ncbi:MAG: glycosyltransferase family 2 protein [Patescibacteria group bacterium]